MRDLTNKMFQLFYKVNKLNREDNFARREAFYSGIGYTSMPKEELKKTFDFAGFVDGHLGKPHKFKAVKGTPESAPRAAEVSSIENILSELQKMPIDDREGRYTLQYELGKFAR